jgi:predicted N-acetyltransferase YhbS
LLSEDETLIIRQEKPSEFQEIYNLVKVAFQTAKVSNGKEQDYVDKLRASRNYLPELALVAEEDTKLVGHIMLTKTYVALADSKFEALLLAPLSVELAYRNRGVGSKLVNESFRLAKHSWYKVVFVVGNPAYYGRFGFKPSVLFGIKHVPPIPDQNVMAYELSAGTLAGVAGTVTFT